MLHLQTRDEREEKNDTKSVLPVKQKTTSPNPNIRPFPPEEQIRNRQQEKKRGKKGGEINKAIRSQILMLWTELKNGD